MRSPRLGNASEIKVMPKQVSGLNTVVIAQYINKTCPGGSLENIVTQTHASQVFYIQNLKTGKVEPVSAKHLIQVHNWFSNLFMITLYEILEKTIPDPDLALKIGRTSYQSHHFLKTAVGIPVLGTYKLLDRISRENEKYNRTKKIRITEKRQGFVRIRVEHKENILINDFAMKWHVGVFESYALLSGATDVKVDAGYIDKGPAQYGSPEQGIWEFEISFSDHPWHKRIFNSILYKIPAVQNIIESANHIQKEHNEQILQRENIIQKRTDELKKIHQKMFEEERNLIQKKLHTLSDELIVTEDRERHSLAEDLHDSASQSLAIAMSKIKATINSNKADPEDLIETKDYIAQAISDIRSVTFQVCPPILYSLGLDAALSWLITDINQKNNMKIKYENKVDGSVNLPDNKKIFIYRSVRELIINIIKHAGTEDGHVMLWRNNKNLVVEVRDNGAGFEADLCQESDSMSFGLFSIKKRFDAIGGNVDIKSTRGKGAEIVLSIPIPA